MNDETYKEFLSLLMCSDPWPVGHRRDSQRVLINFANNEAIKRGYIDWVVAYHDI